MDFLHGGDKGNGGGGGGSLKNWRQARWQWVCLHFHCLWVNLISICIARFIRISRVVWRSRIVSLSLMLPANPSQKVATKALLFQEDWWRHETEWHTVQQWSWPVKEGVTKRLQKRHSQAIYKTLQKVARIDIRGSAYTQTGVVHVKASADRRETMEAILALSEEKWWVSTL